MHDLPVVDQHPYNFIQALGLDCKGGKRSYLAAQVETGQTVVIKQFRFAQAATQWQGYKAYQREIDVLRQLEHPRIPRYLDAFETADGFCMVQEYKQAPSLAEPRYYSLSTLKTIACSILEILVDLQTQTPRIIHRDLKPEHVLVNRYGQAYLVDFGLARLQSAQVAVSSIAAGTPGFMPPEELFDRPLTAAADLYSLGATLIAVLTQTRSAEIGHLIDDGYAFNLEAIPPSLSPQFLRWLQRMVAPQVKQRYANAAEALAALHPIQMMATPTRVSQRRDRERWLWIGGAAIAGLLTWEMIDPIHWTRPVPVASPAVTLSVP